MELVSIESAEENAFLMAEQESFGTLWWTGALLDLQTKSKWQWGGNGSLWSAHGTEGDYKQSPEGESEAQEVGWVGYEGFVGYIGPRLSIRLITLV